MRGDGCFFGGQRGRTVCAAFAAGLRFAQLDAAGFEKAYNAMVSLKGDGGRPLAIRPNVLLVPPALENAAKELVEGDRLANGTYNPNKGKAKVIVSPWLL